jgi:RND superfamily putative drug exporter
MASLLGMLAFPVMLLRSVAVAGTAVVFMALVAALIFLPAGLSVLGHRIDWLSFGRDAKRDGWHGPLGRRRTNGRRSGGTTAGRHAR